MNYYAPPTKLLIIAQSARMLAKMAVDAGIPCVTVDGYADQDTTMLALESHVLAQLAGPEFERLIVELCQRHQFSHALYGSGFECNSQSLAFLATQVALLGCSPEAFAVFLDKARLFTCLARLQIPYPSSRFTPPQSGGWLIKPSSGQGGVGIRHWAFSDEAITDGSVYWQQYMPGAYYSVLASISAQNIRVLGFNQQWSHDDGFVFASIANHAQLSELIRQQVLDWLEQLVQQYDLTGLISLDFLVSEDGLAWFLELNPRISASAQLYPQALNIHIHDCLGLSLSVEMPVEAKVYAVLFAKQDILIQEGFSWPDYVVDRPITGQWIQQGQPICSIISGFSGGQSPQKLVAQRLNSLERLLQTGCNYAISSQC